MKRSFKLFMIALLVSASLMVSASFSGCSSNTQVQESSQPEQVSKEKVIVTGDFGFADKGGYAELLYYSGSMGAEEIHVPDSANGIPVKVISDKVFNNCEKAKYIYIPKTVETIGKNAFDSCFALESMDIPDSVITLKEGCFKYCKSLKEVKMSKNLREIEDYVFAGCENLTTITIPIGVGSIPDHAFSNCYNLLSIGRDDFDISYQTQFRGYGITGSFKQCENWTKDVMMNDTDGTGVYSAILRDVEPGFYEYKIRANGEWTDSWGEVENGYTYNSQINCNVTIEKKSDIKIFMDTSDKDDKLHWKVKSSIIS